MGFEVTVY